MSVRMNDLSWEQFRDRVPSACDLAIVPVGTIEAHGAIPLGTDTIIPEALAGRSRAAAERADRAARSPTA